MATYGLVKYTQFVDDFVTWMEDTSPIISSEISSDVNQLLQAALVEWNGFFKLKKKKVLNISQFPHHYFICLFIWFFKPNWFKTPKTLREWWTTLRWLHSKMEVIELRHIFPTETALSLKDLSYNTNSSLHTFLEQCYCEKNQKAGRILWLTLNVLWYTSSITTYYTSFFLST